MVDLKAVGPTIADPERSKGRWALCPRGCPDADPTGYDIYAFLYHGRVNDEWAFRRLFESPL